MRYLTKINYKMSNSPLPTVTTDTIVENTIAEAPVSSDKLDFEMLKRLFYNDRPAFHDMLRSYVDRKLVNLYIGRYRYNSDFDGSQDYVARNFNIGFSLSLAEHTRHGFYVLRCIQPREDVKKYTYYSLWITPLQLQSSDVDEVTVSSILDSKFADYTFENISLDDTEWVFNEVQKAEIYTPVITASSAVAADDDDEFEPVVAYEPAEFDPCISEIYLH